jgi:phenylacetaldehyde dehydrogenase
MSAVSLLNTRLEALRASFLARDHKLFVDGHWVAAQSGQSFDVLDPATGERLARAAAGEAADIDRAVAVRAARKAFSPAPGRA